MSKTSSILIAAGFTISSIVVAAAEPIESLAGTLVESKLFSRIHRLNEQVGRMRNLLERVDIEPETRNEAKLIRRDISNPDLGL